jgi:hypothetical protein
VVPLASDAAGPAPPPRRAARSSLPHERIVAWRTNKRHKTRPRTRTAPRSPRRVPRSDFQGWGYPKGTSANSDPVLDTNLYDVQDLWDAPPTPESFRKVLPPPIVGKPPRNVFFRANPDPGYTVTTKTLEMSTPEHKTKQWYWVPRHLWDAPVLREELVVVRVFILKTNSDVLYLWPVKLFDEEHGSFKWTQTALMAIEEAKHRYVKVVGDISYGGYVATVAERDHGEPKWPTEPLSKLVEQAFGPRRTITSLDHEAVKKLTGEII